MLKARMYWNNQFSCDLQVKPTDWDIGSIKLLIGVLRKVIVFAYVVI